MSTHLLDANMLIALVVAEHEHHHRALRWLATVPRFAVCPIVEGALARVMLRFGESPATVKALLDSVRTLERCEFWPDDVSYTDVDLTDLRGHRQVTDVYLAALAHARGGRLATLDEGLAALRPHHVTLVPR